MKSMPCKECLKYAVCVSLVNESGQIAPLYRRCDLADKYIPEPDKNLVEFETKLNILRELFGLEKKRLHQGVHRTHERHSTL